MLFSQRLKVIIETMSRAQISRNTLLGESAQAAEKQKCVYQKWLNLEMTPKIKIFLHQRTNLLGCQVWVKIFKTIIFINRNNYQGSLSDNRVLAHQNLQFDCQFKPMQGYIQVYISMVVLCYIVKSRKCRAFKSVKMQIKK